MRSTRSHIALVALAAAAVVSCDTRLPTAVRRAAPGTPPDIVIDTPLVNAQINVGDSLYMRVLATGGNALKTIELAVFAVSGVKDLGTYAETPRYKEVTIPLPPGTTDTVVRRYLQPINPDNTALDSLIVQAIVIDSTGLRDTARVRATLVSGPKVNIESPVPNDSVTPGVALGIQVHATDNDGIVQVQVRVQGSSTWPTPLDTTVIATFGGTQRDLVFTTAALVPANAPGRSRITVSASAIDGNRQPGTANPVSIFVRSAASIAPPLVTQVVPLRSERTDTITVNANGAGIAEVGVIVRDSVGTLLDSIPVAMPTPFTSNVKQGVALRLPIAAQGKHLAITAYAIDQAGRIGYAVRSPTLPPVTTRSAAIVDSTTIVFGQTYTLPIPGTIGDLAVDVGRGNVFLSNIENNKLEVWQNATKGFDAVGIAVGSLPWGLFVSATNPDTLLVANSGGTNISRVFIGDATVANLHEDLPNRILTRNVYVHVLTEFRDGNTGKITIQQQPVRSYSDRPQYLAQATTGRIYFSTRPTEFAEEGTIRYVETNPIYPAPDPRIIHDYVPTEPGTEFRYAIFNVDSIKVFLAPPQSSLSDRVAIYDHVYGSNDEKAVICVNGFDAVNNVQCEGSTFDGTPVSAGGVPDGGIQSIINTLMRKGSDVDSRIRLDMAKLPLKDTTFVTSSFDHKWIAFGEGNSAPAEDGARIIMVADSLSAPAFTRPQFSSPQVTVRDLTENASERVFGIGLDRSGKTLASHGLESYFTEVASPFHLRLQGKFNTLDEGAGIALHPLADGRNTPMPSRLAFVASSKGDIEIVDIAYFISRGKLSLKYPIYGALKASLPMPGDDPSVILKLFALTQRGLIVVDVTQADIKPGPP
jgi:hypothetical protein